MDKHKGSAIANVRARARARENLYIKTRRAAHKFTFKVCEGKNSRLFHSGMGRETV